jgi:large subunit ribosomal protein L6
MSRIGKMPITIPSQTKVDVKGQHITVEGPKGKLDFDLPRPASAAVKENQILITRRDDTAESKAMHGLSRSIVNNMVDGVSKGFVKKLEIHGVGFKAAVQGKNITMHLGYSHSIEYAIPAQIKVTVEENTKVTIEGPDKSVVGRVASELRSFYPPEPYKGKGVRYAGERIVRKEGKTVQ